MARSMKVFERLGFLDDRLHGLRQRGGASKAGCQAGRVVLREVLAASIHNDQLMCTS